MQQLYSTQDARCGYKQPFDSFFDTSDTSATFHNNHDLTRRPLIPPSSVIPSMLGVGYNAPCAIWDWCTGTKPQPDISNLPHIINGKEKEPIAIKHFYKQFPQYSGFKAGVSSRRLVSTQLILVTT